MSYFNSLSSYKATQTAVAQHTTDMEQSVKDGKAAAAAKAYEGYSQLLETAGGSTTGLAGGFHLTRKIYKKYQAKKATDKEAKDKASQDELDKKNQDAEDDADAEDDMPEPEDFEEGSTEEAKTSSSTAGEVDDGVAQAKNTGAEDLTKEGDEADDKEAEDDLPEPEEFEEGSSTADDVKGSDTFASQSDAPTDNTRTFDFNTQGADTIEDLKPSTTAPSVMEDDDLNSGFRISNTNAPDVDQGNTDMLSKDEGGQEPTQETEGTQRNPDNLGEEPDAEKTNENQLEGDEPVEEDLPDPVDFKELNTQSGEGADTGGKAVEVDAGDQEATGGFQAGAETTDADLTTAGSADRIEQGAAAFSKITPTPTGGAGGLGLGADAGADDIASAGSSLLDSGLEIASTALDFLGPVGEIAGAGIALGGFFHSLFDSGESKKESDDEDAPTDISQGGGISSTSLQTQSQTSTQVGTSY